MADVLYRRKRADVPIPAAMLETVQAMYRHKAQKRRTTCPPPNVSAHTVLAQYTAACHELNVQRRRCKQAGIPSQTLDLLRESIQVAEGVNGDGTG